MLRRFGREVARVGRVTLWTIAAAALNFGAGIVLARMLGPSERGFVAVVVSLAGVGSIVAGAGTSMAFRALLPKGNLVNVKGFAFLTIILVLGSIPLLLTAGGIIAIAVDSRIASSATFTLFVCFGVTNLVWLHAKEALNATGKIAESAAVGALGAALFLGLVILVAALHPQAYSRGVLFCYIIMNACQVVVTVVLLRQYFRPGPPLGARAIVKVGPGFLVYSLGQELALRLDRTLVASYSSTSSAGFFAIGAGMAEVLRLPVLASSQYVLLHSAQGRLSARGVMQRVGFWMILVALAASVLWLMAPILVVSIYGPDFAGAIDPFRVLLLAQVVIVPFLVVSRALVGLGGRWAAGLPGVAGLPVLIVLGSIFIGRWGATGGALACVAAFMTMSIVAVGALFGVKRVGAEVDQLREGKA